MYEGDWFAILFVIFCIVGWVAFDWYSERQQCYNAYSQFEPEYVGYATGCVISVDVLRVPAKVLQVSVND